MGHLILAILKLYGLILIHFSLIFIHYSLIIYKIKKKIKIMSNVLSSSFSHLWDHHINPKQKSRLLMPHWVSSSLSGKPSHLTSELRDGEVCFHQRSPLWRPGWEMAWTRRLPLPWRWHKSTSLSFVFLPGHCVPACPVGRGAQASVDGFPSSRPSFCLLSLT